VILIHTFPRPAALHVEFEKDVIILQVQMQGLELGRVISILKGDQEKKIAGVPKREEL